MHTTKLYSKVHD